MPAPASSRSTVAIDLSGPYRVGEHVARHQSVWMLARIWLAASRDREDLGAATVRARFADAANVRMIVSRAFNDFVRWGVPVGWGHDKAIGISALRADGRSRGPFWMSAATAGRLRFTAHGRPLGATGVARWLGQAPAGEAAPAAEASSEGLQYVMRDMAFWRHLTQAMRGAQDGFAGVLDHGVAESFRAAHRTAADDFQQALSLLKESLAWRRSDRLDKSRAALRRFERIVVAGGVNAALPTFAAMAHVVRAWEHYARGELDAAQRELARLSGDAELRPVVRYNPRIRFETLNLEALVHKSIALRPDGSNGPNGLGPAAAQASASQRQDAARLALDAFAGALQAAYEADSVDAVQHAAANIGWSLWLFWLYRLVDVAREMAPGDVQRQAMRWLGLSEWICDRFGVGGRDGVEHDLPVARGARQRQRRPARVACRVPRRAATDGGGRHRRPAPVSRTVRASQGLCALVVRGGLRAGGTRHRPRVLQRAATGQSSAGIGLASHARAGSIGTGLRRHGAAGYAARRAARRRARLFPFGNPCLSARTARGRRRSGTRAARTEGRDLNRVNQAWP
ncbi:hypothetical protein [Cupriavidus pauculus]|uniref:hypothetical protein n=1 Tax=Cupriavidus pauculus TaxID=82633 RepID=UPI0027E4DD5E|nr:hypothetical protein [Cupriavidus pauculus]